MSSFNKYRIRDVAKDFGMTTKEISDIVTKYFEKPKSNMQVLDDQQLNVLFEHITQNHQIASLEQVFAVAPAKPKQEAPAPKKEEKAPAQAAAKPQPAQQGQQSQKQGKPAAQQEPQR